MEVVGSHPHRERRVERVVFGGTLWSQNSLLLHNEQDLSIAIPYRPKQVHSTFRGASHVLLVFWVDHLFQPFFIIVWMCLDCLFCRLPSPKPSRSVTGTGAHPDAFHCHRVPDSFQLPHCDGFVEVRPRDPLDLVRAPLVFVRYRACFLLEGEKVLGDFPGLCKILHETTLLGSCIPVFSPTFVGTGLSWLYCMWRMEAIGRRWSLIVPCWAAGI